MHVNKYGCSIKDLLFLLFV